MIPVFSCHGHGEISTHRRAREEVPDNYCRPSTRFFIFKCSSVSLLFVALPNVTDSYPESSLCKIFIFRFGEMVDFVHLFCGVKTLSPLRLWPLFHSGFIIKQSFLPLLIPRH